MFPVNPTSVTVGAEWFTVNSTSETFPTTGVAASTTTHASSQVLNLRNCVIEGIMLDTAGTATTVTLTTWVSGSSATADTFPIPATGNEGIFAPWGIDGINSFGDFGVKLTSGTGTVLIFYRRIF